MQGASFWGVQDFQTVDSQKECDSTEVILRGWIRNPPGVWTQAINDLA